MKKYSRILAIIGIILLVALYLSTLFFAIFDRSESLGLLKASIAGTFIIPIMLYGCSLLSKLVDKTKDDTDDDK